MPATESPFARAFARADAETPAGAAGGAGLGIEVDQRGRAATLPSLSRIRPPG